MSVDSLNVMAANTGYVLKHEPLYWHGREILLIKDSYRRNGHLCIKFFDKETKEPSGVLSCNMPEVMGDNEIIVKDYSENDGKKLLFL